MTTLKDIENELNSKKGEFVKDIVSDTVSTVTKLAQKTKSEKHANAMIKEARELAKENQKYEDIVITGGTASITEPSVKITYPNLMNRVFEEGKPIKLTLETKNVKFPYTCYTFAISSGNKIPLDVKRDIQSNTYEIPDILLHRKLPVGKHDIIIVLYQNNTSNIITDSKGNPVADRAVGIQGIEIVPPKTASTGTKTNKPTEKADEAITKEEEKISKDKDLKKKENIEKRIKKKNSSPINEPSIRIIYPTLSDRVFNEGDPIPVIFETHNVSKPYKCVIYAVTRDGKIIYIAGKSNITWDGNVNMPDIQQSQKLSAGEYNIVVELFENLSSNRIINSKGEPLIAKILGDKGIIINPKKPIIDSSKDKKPIKSEEKTRFKKPGFISKLLGKGKDKDSLKKVKHIRSSWRSLVAAALIPITLYYSVSPKHISFGGPRHEIDKTIVIGTNNEVLNEAEFMVLTHDAEFKAVDDGITVSKQYTIINDYPATFSPTFDPKSSTLTDTSQFDKISDECKRISQDFFNLSSTNTEKIIANLKPILDKEHLSVSDVNKNIGKDKIIESLIRTQGFIFDSVEVIGTACIKGTSLVPYENFETKKDANISLGFGRGQRLGGGFIIPKIQRVLKQNGLDSSLANKIVYSGMIIYNSEGVNMTVVTVNQWLSNNPNKVSFGEKTISNINLDLIHSADLYESSKLDAVLNYFKIHEPGLYTQIVGDPARHHVGGYLSDDRGVQICIKGHITADVKAGLIIEKFVDPAIPSSYPQDKIIEGTDPQYDERKKQWNRPQTLKSQNYDLGRSKTGREPANTGKNFKIGFNGNTGRKNMQYSGRGNRGK